MYGYDHATRLELERLERCRDDLSRVISIPFTLSVPGPQGRYVVHHDGGSASFEPFRTR